MDTERYMEPGDRWGKRLGGEEWARLESLLALVRYAHIIERS